MFKLLANPNTNKLTEIFQSNAVQFAFVNHTNSQEKLQLLMPWIKCREYFNELLMVNHHPEDFNFKEVHGFQYDHAQFPLNKDKVFLAVRFPDVKTRNNFTNNLNFLHSVEKFNNLDQLTTIHKTDKSTVLVLEASKFWQQRCILLNIYTLLIKLGSIGFPQTPISILNESEFANSTELNYTKILKLERLDSLLQNLTAVCEIPVKYVDGSEQLREPYTVHGHSGIISLLTTTKDKRIESFHKAFNDLLQKSKAFFFKEATT